MQKTISFLIKGLYRDFYRYATAELKELGVSYGQLPFLLYIGKHPSTSQGALKKATQADWGHAKRSVDRLIEAGFVERFCDPTDKRRSLLLLSPKGEDAYRFCHELFHRWDEAHLGALNEEEEAQLLRLLEKIAGKGEPEQ